MSFGENLQTIRTKHNITQEQLAEQLEVTRQSVSKWESGVSYPEMNTILKICEMYQVSMDELMRGTIEEKDEKEQMLFEKQMKGFALKIASAVAMIIAAVGITAILDACKVADNISGVVLLSFVVIAVIIMIVAGMENERFTKKHPTMHPYHTEEEIEKFDKKYAWMIAGAVGVILIGVIIMCAFDGSVYEDVAGGGFLFLVAGAVFTLIYGGCQRSIWHVEEYNKSNRPSKEDRRIGNVCGCIMLLATIIFLLWGFLGTAPDAYAQRFDNAWWARSGWSISWIAFPVGGILCGIASLLLKKED